MKSYYVNRNSQSSGDHEVHRSDCVWLPNHENRIYLGEFSNCRDAVAKAKRDYFNKADGCAYCCKEAHTS